MSTEQHFPVAEESEDDDEGENPSGPKILNGFKP